MRSKILLGSWFTIATLAAGQNLVPNPSFEDYTICPNDLDQIDRVVSWLSIGNSPDYFNACADDTVSVPFNALGDQEPSDGDGYLGVVSSHPAYKEYIQAELTDTLVLGVPTHISMRVSPGGFGYQNWARVRYAASGMGMRLSTLPLDLLIVPGGFDFNSAVLRMQLVLSDTSTWTVLSGSFIPDSAYKYVQIGNFFADSLSTIIEIDPQGDV